MDRWRLGAARRVRVSMEGYGCRFSHGASAAATGQNRALHDQVKKRKSPYDPSPGCVHTESGGAEGSS